MLFLQGTKDTLAYFDLISKVTASLPLATLAPIEGADHSFNKGKAAIMDQLIDESLRFIRKHV
jgi:pimeloyl-ACP methyl ester carboxylesterase